MGLLDATNVPAMGNPPDAQRLSAIFRRSFVKAKRSGAAVGLLAAGTLLLSACGSDNNTSSEAGSGESGSATTGDCGGKEVAEGERFFRTGQRDDALHQRL